MIVEKFATLFQTIIFKLLNGIHIPRFGYIDNFDQVVSIIIEYGCNIVLFFIPATMLKTSLGIAVGIIAFKYGYYLIMWILKKIPAVGIN